jgi:hypothetical protein
MAKIKKKRKGSKVYKAVALELRESCKHLREALKEKELMV